MNTNDPRFTYVYAVFNMANVTNPALKDDIVGWFTENGLTEVLRCPLCNVGELKHVEGCPFGHMVEIAKELIGEIGRQIGERVGDEMPPSELELIHERAGS